jgi:hypothetical protein
MISEKIYYILFATILFITIIFIQTSKLETFRSASRTANANNAKLTAKVDDKIIEQKLKSVQGKAKNIKDLADKRLKDAKTADNKASIAKAASDKAKKDSETKFNLARRVPNKNNQNAANKAATHATATSRTLERALQDATNAKVIADNTKRASDIVEAVISKLKNKTQLDAKDNSIITVLSDKTPVDAAITKILEINSTPLSSTPTPKTILTPKTTPTQKTTTSSAKTNNNTQQNTRQVAGNKAIDKCASAAFRDELNREKIRNEGLKQKHNEMKARLNGCQARINNSNLTNDQRNALVAAQKQLEISKNILEKANNASNKTQLALKNQDEISNIIKQYEIQSVKTLEDANKKVNNNNQEFAKKIQQNGVLVSISDNKEFFSNMNVNFTNADMNCKRKYKKVDDWQNEWRKDLQ